MLSIIIPVYNTEKYLPKCLESILTQDYRDYEIIAVNDGSKDDSLVVLKEYANKDSRIKIIDKENEGQGVARNHAIKKAKGDVLYFIDSDDWISEGSLAAMVARMETTNADVVVGNSACTCLDEETIAKNNAEKVSGILEKANQKAQLFNISGCTWPKFIKKSLFIDNEIEFPAIYFEDLATMPRIYAMANKIAFLDKCVYIQRMNSKSTVHRPELIYDRIKFVEYLVDGFKKLGIYEEYEESINEYLCKRAQINLRMVKTLANAMYMKFAETQREIFKDKYGIDTLTSKRCFAVGSYNLMIFAKIFMRLEDSATVENYYGGSSLISIMNADNTHLNQLSVFHANDFRRKMLISDFEKTLLHMNPGNFYEYDYFFVDLLEERFDIGIYEGEYFTISQAFMDIAASLQIGHYKVVKAFTEKWWELWKKACIDFIRRLELIVQSKPVVLIKSYLSEIKYDDDGQEYFPDIEEIRSINQQLSKCYELFEQNCSNAICVEIKQMDEYKTEKNFRHGCYPWHLSGYAYGVIASYIEAEVASHKRTSTN